MLFYAFNTAFAAEYYSARLSKEEALKHFRSMYSRQGQQIAFYMALSTSDLVYAVGDSARAITELYER
jgi:hypothetical protein